MGCVSSKILAKSGSFQEKVSGLGHAHGFQRSSAIEEIILSTSKSSGDQFMALLRTSSRTSSSSAEAHSPAAPPAAAAARIETVDVAELLAGLEEGSCGTAGEAQAPPRPRASAGRARSFRTVEELDAMLLLTQHQQQQQEEDEKLATGTAGEEVARVSEGAKRRGRARHLGELQVPAAFDFSKSGSLRDWLRQGGQTFSPGSYVTPRFGPPAAAERGGGTAGEEQEQQQQQALLFDPELVAQLERAMEQLSEERGRVLDQILGCK